jgi:hypothetical protein
MLLSACLAMLILFLAPLAGLAWWPTILPALIALCCIGASYRVMSNYSHIDARYGWLYPVGALVMAWAMARSMLSVMVRRGVMWRGTLYSLRELRMHNSPWQWERSAAMARRAEEKRKTVGARLLALWPALRSRQRKKR